MHVTNRPSTSAKTVNLSYFLKKLVMKKAFCNGLENITMKNDDKILIQELLDSSNDNISIMSIITNTHPNFINISDAETEEQIINGIGKVDSIFFERG